MNTHLRTLSVTIHAVKSLFLSDIYGERNRKNAFSYVDNAYEMIIGFILHDQFISFQANPDIHTTSEYGNHGFPITNPGESFGDTYRRFSLAYDTPEAIVVSNGFVSSDEFDYNTLIVLKD